jgi:hypothetical protein
MGCSTGACGVPQRLSQATARRDGACCDECAQEDEDRYRASFLALSPWGFRHAGKIISDDGTLVGGTYGGGNADDPGSTGLGDPSRSSSDASAKGSSGGGDAGWRTAAELGTAAVNAGRDIAQTAITERERTARAQAGYGTDGVMPPERSGTYSSTTDDTSSSDGSSMGLLVAAAVVAGALSGAFKGLLK